MTWDKFGIILRNKSAVLCVVAICGTGASGAEADTETRPAGTDTVVDTHLGPVSGEVSGNIHVYRGIPYAAPPVREQRWRDPVDPDPWTDVRACDEFGPVCPQPDMGLLGFFATGPKPNRCEDCLYLNVFTLARRDGAKLPVMVWIHGGGLYYGAGSAPWYDGTRLAQRGVVVVTFNYRLGMFGFLAHRNLTEESCQAASGYYGLMDQIHALNWVQTNIEAFGGDPQNVTIFGESAGGMSVCALMCARRASTKGLFHKAICQSGGAIDGLRCLRKSRPNCPSGHELGDEFAERLGVPSGNLDEMRAKSWQEVLDAYPKLGSDSWRPAVPGDGVRTFLMIDDYLLVKSPADLFREGKQAQVPLLIGSNRDEGSLFSHPSNPYMARLKYRWIESHIPLSLRERFRELYPDRKPLSAARSVTDWLGDALVCSTRSTVRLHAESGQNTYQYEFARAPGLLEPLGLGAFHFAEIPYVFGTLPSWSAIASFSRDDRALSNAMQRYWVNFATTGDPNNRELPPWPHFAPAEDQHQILDVRIETGEKLRRDQCEFRQQLPWTCGTLPQFSKVPTPSVKVKGATKSRGRCRHRLLSVFRR